MTFLSRQKTYFYLRDTTSKKKKKKQLLLVTRSYHVKPVTFTYDIPKSSKTSYFHLRDPTRLKVVTITYEILSRQKSYFYLQNPYVIKTVTFTYYIRITRLAKEETQTSQVIQEPETPP